MKIRASVPKSLSMFDKNEYFFSLKNENLGGSHSVRDINDKRLSITLFCAPETNKKNLKNEETDPEK